jgi:hypothetical protein
MTVSGDWYKLGGPGRRRGREIKMDEEDSVRNRFSDLSNLMEW